LHRGVGVNAAIAGVLQHLAWLAYREGDYATACARAEESLAIQRKLDDQRGIGSGLLYLGLVALAEGQVEKAGDHLCDCLVVWRSDANEPGNLDRKGLVQCLEGLADIALAQGRPDRATRLLGAAAALHETICRPAPSLYRAEQEQHLT